MNILWFGLGLAFAAATIGLFRPLGLARERLALTMTLVAAAVIYVGFGLVWGSTAWVAIEIVGVAVYALPAALSLIRGPIWLAIGWAAHPLWDVGLHLLGPGAHVAPHWYAVACLSFDLLVAAYVLVRFMGSKKAH